MKATLKSSAVRTDRNGELLDFAKGIEFDPLFDEIKKIANVDCEFENLEIASENGADVGIEICSTDITDQIGAFAAALKSCVIRVYSQVSVAKRNTELISEGELYAWFSIGLSYSHFGGGSNGSDIANAWYTENNGWTFLSQKERYNR